MALRALNRMPIAFVCLLALGIHSGEDAVAEPLDHGAPPDPAPRQAANLPHLTGRLMALGGIARYPHAEGVAGSTSLQAGLGLFLAPSLSVELVVQSNDVWRNLTGQTSAAFGAGPRVTGWLGRAVALETGVDILAIADSHPSSCWFGCFEPFPYAWHRGLAAVVGLRVPFARKADRNGPLTLGVEYRHIVTDAQSPWGTQGNAVFVSFGIQLIGYRNIYFTQPGRRSEL